jgi:hypothetical protein
MRHAGRCARTADERITDERIADQGNAAMEINRNQYFMVGLVVLLLGVQFRMVESFVLNEQTTAIVEKQLKTTVLASAESGAAALAQSAPSASFRVVRPPKWLGWAFISVGGILILHSLAMQRPQ